MRSPTINGGFPVLAVLISAGLLCVTGVFSPPETDAADAGQYRWWPRQKAPQAIVHTHLRLMREVVEPDGSKASIALGPEHMLAQSVAGLAAQAVNEGRGDELVWIGLASDDYSRWHEGMTNRLGLADHGVFEPWELVKRFAAKGVVKGYILYRYDFSPGGATHLRPGSDESVNVATSLAGLLQGVLVSEGQEEQARRLGLKKLFDARGKTEAWCFENYRDRLNRGFVLVQDPQMPHCRDLAIAHRMLAVFGHDTPTPEVYAWLHPLSSVIGWNGGEEAKSVAPISRAGHTLLPCNWSMNLCALSAGTDTATPGKLRSARPRLARIDDQAQAVSFIMSDGDNVQWLMGGFCFDARYWANTNRGQFPVGWGTPLACLDQACPEVLSYLRQTQPPDTTLSLHGGGYFYPDLLGVDRSPAERRVILTDHARRMGHYVRRSGASTLLLLAMDLDSPAAHEAYQIIAREIPELLGIFVIQYYPYEAGDGKVFWVRARDGTEVPVVTCKYRLWGNTPASKPRAGTPAKIARSINISAQEAEAAGQRLNAWAITHVWSDFKPAPGNDESAEDAAGAPDAQRALAPTGWCIERLDSKVKVVSPEELLWRIRLEHAPGPTKRLLRRPGAS